MWSFDTNRHSDLQAQDQILLHQDGLLGELTVSMQAPPVAICSLSGGLYALADAAGGLHMLDARGEQVWRLGMLRTDRN